MRLVGLFILAVSPLFAGVREDALQFAHEAGKLIESDPSKSSQLAEKAYDLLASDDSIQAPDLAACAGLAARAARLANDTGRAQLWFQKALTHAAPEGATVVRAELADMLMRAGKLPEARQALGPTPTLNAPSPPLAQWHQTSAKLHLTCGLPEKAQSAIKAAIESLPTDDTANHIALAIDAAGIALRLGQPVTGLIEDAREKLKTLASPDPALISALTSIAAQSPDLDDAGALSLLQSLDLSTLPDDLRISYAATLGEAALRNGNRNLAVSTLTPVIQSDLLPDDHPLLARSLGLMADAKEDSDLARRSSEVAMRWLENSGDSDILLGLQRTVDPLSPLINHAFADLPEIALTAQNYALRERIGGSVAPPERQTVLYLLYEKNFEQRYGALVFSKEVRWLDLGSAAKIHQRIFDTVETAERTLGEVNVGATLSVRLTQLWKSLWAPLANHLDSGQPIDIAPVGMLHAVPWSILRQRDGRHLCEILSEARILALTGRMPQLTSSKQLTVCGIESAPGTLPAAGSFPFDHELSEVISGLPKLPGVKAEVSRLGGISHLNPGREEFLSLLENHEGTLHLAGHGFVIESEEGHGFRAGLVLHGGGTENILFAKEIARLDLSRTNLVVLSACRGGIGQGEVGGNWSSLRRSFIAAGAARVMAAQWRVRDDHLPDFMASFHEARLKDPPHLALWKLQRKRVMANKTDEIALASTGAWVLESVPLP